MLEKPYPEPLGPGVVARVQLARHASTWMSDIEAYLVERGLTTELAPAVCKFIDYWDTTLEATVNAFEQVLKAHPPENDESPRP